MAIAPAVVEHTFRAFEWAAASGQRCPQNGVDGVSSEAGVTLAHAGRIEIRISGRNFRTVGILQGPHKGRWTAPDPAKGRIWKIINQKGTRIIRGPSGVPAAEPPHGRRPE